MFVNPYHVHIHQVDYEDEKNFINCRHRSLSMQCIQQFYAVFSTSKSVQKPPKTKQKQSSICILTVESRPIYAKLKFSNLEVYGTTDERTNEGGGGWTLNLFLSTSSSDYPRTGVFHQLQQLSTRK